MGIIVERPADRHLDELSLLPEMVWLSELRPIPFARTIGPIIIPHHAGIVLKAVREQKLDGVLAQPPGGRGIAARLAAGRRPRGVVGAAGKPALGVVCAPEIGPPLVPALLPRRHMPPAVMGHFVAVPHHILACGGM